MVNQLARILAAIVSDSCLLLEGPPGTGKTAVVNQAAALFGVKCERINFSANTTVDQLIGGIVPRCSAGQRVFEWQDGKLLKAIKEKKWLLLDELNLAPPEILDALAPLFTRATEYTVPHREEKVSTEGIRVFAAINPAKIGGGRNQLPRSIKSLFASVKLEEYQDQELRVIMTKIFEKELSERSVEVSQLAQIFKLHQNVRADVASGKIGKTSGPYEFNLRDLTKFKDLLHGNFRDQQHHHKFYRQKELSSIETMDEMTLSVLRKLAEVVYVYPFQTAEDHQHVRSLIDIYLPLRDLDQAPPSLEDNESMSSVRIGSVYLTKGAYHEDSVPLQHSKETIKNLELLALATQSKRTILLEGETASAKTARVQELARLTKRKLVVLSLNQDVETSDLIGQWLLSSSNAAIDQRLPHLSEFVDRVVKDFVLTAAPLLSKEELPTTFSDVKVA